MRIEEIKSKEVWDKCVSAQSPNTFMQSWAWGQFNASMGQKTFRLGIFDESELVGAALAVKIAAKRGNFLYIPHGPIFSPMSEEFLISSFEFLVKHLKHLAQKENCNFMRISPILLNTEKNRKLFVGNGFRKAPIHMQAELMWLLDISPAEEIIMKNMRKTTRYEIRRAEKEGVMVEMSNRVEDLEKFSEVYKSTANRQNFVPFSKKYLKNELESFAPDNAVLFFARYKGEIIATALVVFTENETFYHQGASNQKYPKIPAAYLLQLGIIREAKRRGCKIYNFWGISPDDKPRTSFKNIPARVAAEFSADHEARREGVVKDYIAEDKRSERREIPATLRDTANSRYNFVAPPQSSNLLLFCRCSLLYLKFASIATRDIFKRGPHPWAGLSLFKKGFGGYSEEYLPAQDLIINKKYWLNWLVETLRKLKRGL